MKAVEKREPFFPFSEGHLSLMEDGFSIRSAGRRDSPFVSTIEGPRNGQILTTGLAKGREKEVKKWIF